MIFFNFRAPVNELNNHPTGVGWAGLINTDLFGALHLKDLPIIKNYPYGVVTRVAS
mgnify:FL=1